MKERARLKLIHEGTAEGSITPDMIDAECAKATAPTGEAGKAPGAKAPSTHTDTAQRRQLPSIVTKPAPPCIGRRDRPPPPNTTALLAIMPPALATPPGQHHEARPARPALLPGQCANCLTLDAGHSGNTCPNPCTKGICKGLPAQVRTGCQNVRK